MYGRQLDPYFDFDFDFNFNPFTTPACIFFFFFKVVQFSDDFNDNCDDHKRRRRCHRFQSSYYHSTITALRADASVGSCLIQKQTNK